MHGFSVTLRNLIFAKGMSLNQAYFSSYNNVFKHGSSVSWWFLFNASWTPLCQVCFQDIARLWCADSQNVGQITSFQVWRTWIKRTFQIIARCSLTEYQILGKISVFRAWLVSFMHTAQVTPRVSCTESQSLVEFSSIKVGCICMGLTFQHIARFQLGFYVSWRILFGPSGMRFNQAYFPWYSKVFTYRTSVFWRPRCVPNETRYWCQLFQCLLSESHYRSASSSFQLGLTCLKRTFQDIARFRARNSNSWRMHFIPSGTQLCQEARFSRYSQAFMHAILASLLIPSLQWDSLGLIILFKIYPDFQEWNLTFLVNSLL